MPFQVGSVSVHDDGQHTGSAKRGQASGVASLGATSLLPDTQNAQVNTTHIAATRPHTGHAIINNSTFTGDGTANRAIAHGLGRAPKRVFLFAEVLNNVFTYQISANGTAVASNDTVNVSAQTQPDATNFYVSSGYGNTNTQSMHWVAIT